MVKLKIKSSSTAKSSPTQRKAGRKLKAKKEVPMSTHSQSKTIIKANRKVNTKGNCKVKPEEDLLLPIDETKKGDVKSSQIRVSEEYFEVLKKEKFRLTVDDFCDVFGLPNGGHDLELLVTGLASYSSSDGESLKSLWRERYNIVSSKDPIPLYVIKSKFLGNGLTDEEFKQTFVLFAMSSFLAPATGAVVDLRLLSAVQDVSRIHHLNWYMYVLEELVIGVREAVLGAKLKREDAAGGLGHIDRSDVVFPISRKHSSESGEASSLPNNPVGNVRHIVVDLPADIRTDEEVHSSSIDDVHELLLLNERDSELFYKRYMDRMNLIKLKMQARSEQSSLKDSSQVSPSAATQETGTVGGVGTEQLVATPSFFTSQVIQKVDEYANELSDIDQDSVEKEKAPKSPLIEDYVKEHTIEESSISLEDILSNVFSNVEVQEKEAANTKGCVYEEGVDLEDGKKGANAYGKEDGTEEEKDDVKGDANVNGKDDVKDDVKEDDILVDDYLVDVARGNDCFDVGDNVGAEMVNDDNETKTFTDVSAHEHGHDDLFVTAEAVMAESADLLINATMWEMGCWRIIKISVAVICCTQMLSKTMISAKHVFNPMRSLRKQAADYCFLDDCDISLSDNIVIWGTNNYLTKEDMETMIPDKMIMVGVIEWWSLFLNDTCITIDLSILFLGLAQMQPLVRNCSPTKDEKTPKSVLVDEVKSSFLSFIKNNKKECDLNSDMLGNKKEAMLNNLVEKRLIELEECRQSQKGKIRKSAARKKTFCKKLKKSQSPSDSGAKSTITSTFEASAFLSTPPAGPISIMGDTPKSLKSVLGSRKRGRADDGLGCSLRCEGEDNQILLVSVVMRKTQKLLSKMLNLRKQVVDLCFLDDFAKDILSILPGLSMSARVVECWSTLLNSLEFEQRSEPSTMFFALRHMQDMIYSLLDTYDALSPVEETSNRVFASWDTFINCCYGKCHLNSDLIFVPIFHNDHYSCVCINFFNQSTDLLDNILYKENDYSDMFNVAEIVGNHMSLYLKMKNIIKESDCGQFKVRDVKFDWKKKESNNNESGCFMLYNMTQYEGTEFKSNLRVKVSRRSYCAEIAASLIFADMNQYKNFVLDNVKKQEPKKPHILSIVSNARKYKVNISATNEDAISGEKDVPLKVVYALD
ncbi:hypothetical protein KSS87_011054 [Heliosperma pusillum]|nr:hypothetical protein KSS87_015565 [Heliosperma pusillum]KAH9613739.1 hypothetical protein KSS87_011054 [Heliosperma pusillum]